MSNSSTEDSWVIPDALKSSLKMEEPNTDIKIYSGYFLIKRPKYNTSVFGKIIFKWNPRPRVFFTAISENKKDNFDDIKKEPKIFDIEIHSSLFGKARFTEIFENSIKGEIYGSAILGVKTQHVDRVCFNIPNLRRLHGDTVKMSEGNKTHSWNGRTVFENDFYKITIDQSVSFSHKRDVLKAQGGFIILYNGILETKKETMNYEEVKELLFSFSMFLSFINGRRISCMFAQGFLSKEAIWKDYSSLLTNSYQKATSCLPEFQTKGLNDLWKQFYTLWFEKEEKDFLINSIKWYLVANNGEITSDTRTIMAQAALELIFNWWVIEQLKFLNPRRDTAANKIRMILVQSKISLHIPKKLSNLSSLLNKDIKDGPDAIVLIRNAYVHSHKRNRDKIQNIPNYARFEAISLALWYIELSILNILSYGLIYNNRTSEKKFMRAKEEIVPWVITIPK